MAMKIKPVVTYGTTAQYPTHARTEIPIRDLDVIVDEPVERGGANLGSSPTETAMAALIAYTNVIGQKNTHSLGIDLGTVTINTKRRLNGRGFLVEEEIDVSFPEIELTLNCETPASQEKLTRVGEEPAKYCAIAKLFEAAGTDLTVNWVKTNQ